MRKKIATGLFGLVGLVVTTVVPITWPQISTPVGLTILALCGITVIIAVLLLLPEAISWLRQVWGKSLSRVSSEKGDLGNQGTVALVITKIIGNAERFTAVNVALTNRGLPTALLNWRCGYFWKNETKVLEVDFFCTDRSTTVMRPGTVSVKDAYDQYGNFVGPIVPYEKYETLSDTPLEQGGSRVGTISLRTGQSFTSGARLELAVDDVHGHTIRAGHIF